MNFPVLPSSLELMGEVYETIRSAQDTLTVPHIQRPAKPKAPTLSEGVAAGMRKHADKLEAWETEMLAYNASMGKIRMHNMKVDALILAFIKSESGLNDIPKQYQSKVFSKAWSDGHGSGYYGVYQQLCELVEIFE